MPILGLILWGMLTCSRNLWYDELYSAALISNGWWDMLRITAVDAHSPFYYVGLRIFSGLFGNSIVSMKIFSLCFMVGYLLIGKYWVNRLFDKQVSVWFMFTSITMPIMSVQAGNVRMYALALFCMTVTGLMAYELYLEAKPWKWVVFCLAGTGSVYCHTFAMLQTLCIFIIFFVALLVSKQYRKVKSFLLSGIVLSILYSPWLWVTYRQMQIRLEENGGAAADASRPTMYTFIDYCAEWFSALETPIPVVIFGGMALAVVLGYLAMDYMRGHKNYVAGLGVLAIGVTALVGVLLSVYVNPCFLGRYVFPGFGAVALLYAVGMSQVKNGKLRTTLVVCMILLFAMQYQSELALEYDDGLQTYEEFVEENIAPEDAVIASQMHSSMLSVYHPERNFYINGWKLNKNPFSNTQSFTEWSQLQDVSGDIWYIGFAGETPAGYEAYCTYEKTLEFHYMYYDFVIWRLEPR